MKWQNIPKNESCLISESKKTTPKGLNAICRNKAFYWRKVLIYINKKRQFSLHDVAHNYTSNLIFLVFFCL